MARSITLGIADAFAVMLIRGGVSLNESICVHNEAHEITYVLYHAVVSSRYYNLVTEENNFSKEKRVIIYLLNRQKCFVFTFFPMILYDCDNSFKKMVFSALTYH